MVGIEVGGTHITLSSGERVELDNALEHGDLMLRIGDGTPYVRIPGGAEGSHQYDIVSPVESFAARLATALRADNLAGRQLSLTTQLSLAQQLMLAVPGWWAPQTTVDFETALRSKGLAATLVNGAEAAVVGYRLTDAPLPEDVAVVEAKRGYTSVVIVRNCTSKPAALLSSRLVHREGGDALDAAVLRHLVHGLKSVGDEIDPDAAPTIAAARNALDDCRLLRETLSHSSTASLQPQLPGAQHRVRFGRSELDELATPWADSVVTLVRTAIEQSPTGAQAVLLTGGLASMPLLTQRISADLALEVHVPEDLSMVVAKGAAAAEQHSADAARGWRTFWRTRAAASQQKLVRR